jgi:hypothetical protein
MQIVQVRMLQASFPREKSVLTPSKEVPWVVWVTSLEASPFRLTVACPSNQIKTLLVSEGYHVTLWKRGA